MGLGRAMWLSQAPRYEFLDADMVASIEERSQDMKERAVRGRRPLHIIWIALHSQHSISNLK